jgi:hypothetical protein
MSELVDALGKPIVLGKLYGYSTNTSGLGKVLVGEALRTTEGGKVTLTVKRRLAFRYGKPSNYAWDSSKTVSIYSHMVFPVQD